MDFFDNSNEPESSAILEYGAFAYFLMLALSVSLFGIYKLLLGGMDRLLDAEHPNVGYIWLLVGVLCFAAARREWTSRKR